MWRAINRSWMKSTNGATGNPTPSIVERPTNLVYFIDDGDPGWVREEPEQAMPDIRRRRWFRRLLGL